MEFVGSSASRRRIAQSPTPATVHSIRRTWTWRVLGAWKVHLLSSVVVVGGRSPTFFDRLLPPRIAGHLLFYEEEMRIYCCLTRPIPIVVAMHYLKEKGRLTARRWKLAICEGKSQFFAKISWSMFIKALETYSMCSITVNLSCSRVFRPGKWQKNAPRNFFTPTKPRRWHFNSRNFHRFWHNFMFSWSQLFKDYGSSLHFWHILLFIAQISKKGAKKNWKKTKKFSLVISRPIFLQIKKSLELPWPPDIHE